MNPMEIPVGVLTSLIGAPFFLYLILRKLKQSEI
jgi:ABC-type Fe3+-siderophore transport system permease subunit